MENKKYKGWEIMIEGESSKFSTILISPSGDTFDNKTIIWKSAHSAKYYAEKFIEFYIKFEDQQSVQKLTNSNSEIRPISKHE